jgi:hypothetical protein
MLRESIKTEFISLRKSSTNELREFIETSIQSCETDRMNIKSRIKKIETVIKQMAIESDVTANLEDTLSERLENMTLAYNQNFDHLESIQR